MYEPLRYMNGSQLGHWAHDFLVFIRHEGAGVLTNYEMMFYDPNPDSPLPNIGQTFARNLKCKKGTIHSDKCHGRFNDLSEGFGNCSPVVYFELHQFIATGMSPFNRWVRAGRI